MVGTRGRAAPAPSHRIAGEESSRPAVFWRDPPAAITGAVLLVGLLIGLNRSFWFDEVVTAERVTEPTERLVNLLTGGDAVNAPYYLLLQGLTLREGEVLLRLPSVAAVVATLVVTVRLGRRMFGSRAAWLAGALLALHGVMHHHGQEARSYSLAMLAAAGAGWCAYDAVVTGDRRRWWHFGALGAIGACLHLSVVVALVGQVAGVVLIGRQRRHLLTAVSAVAGAGAVVFLFRDYVDARRTRGLAWIPDLTPGELFGVLSRLVTGSPRPVLLVAMAVAVAGPMAWLALRGRPPSANLVSLGLLTGWVLVPVVALLVASVLLQPAFVARYMAVCVPAIALLLAGAIAAAPPRMAWPAGLLAVAVVAAGLWDWRVADDYDEHQDWRGVAAAVERDAAENDLVVVAPSFTARSFRFYVDRRELSGVRILAANPRRPVPGSVGSGGRLFLVRAYGAARPELPADLTQVDADQFDGRLVLEVWRQTGDP